jgi:hypothetical protein
MDQQILEQLAIGVALLIGALAAWSLPFRWNPFRLKRLLAQFVSPEMDRKVPKIVGTIMAIAGVAILVATVVVGKFK